MKKRLLSLLVTVTMMLTAVPALPLSASAQISDRVNSLVAAMPLRDKIAQMMVVEFRDWGDSAATATDFTAMNAAVSNAIASYHFGGVILFSDNLVDVEQSFALVSEMQTAATKDGGIAMIIGADQEGGTVYRLQGGTALPGNMALGATYAANGTRYAYEAGKIIGSELSALGINTNFAPVVDVNNNPNNPVIGLRSFSDDPTIVGQLASASIEGMTQYHVIGCAKHFPGHGDTATDSHYGLPIVDKPLAELEQNELKPYEMAIAQGVDMVMTAHILYPQLESDTIVSAKTGKAEALPATMSDDILTGLLKEKMGFDGIVITDAMNMAGVANQWTTVEAITIAIQAGVDMICGPHALSCEADLVQFDAIIDGVIAAVNNGDIPLSRIDDAVTRILTVKEKRGLLDYNAAEHSVEHAKATVGSDTNRRMERALAAAAVTVIKNDNQAVPLNLTTTSRVLMAVPYDNERAQMIMGWNRAVEAGVVPRGAQVDYVRFSSSTTITDLQKQLDWADTVIVNSEISGADKMAGKHWLSKLPADITAYCKQRGKISVVLSVDKPYDVQLYPHADAILAVYGCKGSSVDPTEALIGGVTGSATAYGPNIIAGVEVALGTFAAEGTLPLAIPVYNSVTARYTAAIAYERGYGLTTAKLEKLVFPDVPQSAWYYDAACYVHDHDFMTGYQNGLFGGVDHLQRQDFVVMLARIAHADLTMYADSTSGMNDIDPHAYYAAAVAWAVDNGIITGYQNGDFGVGDSITREQVATILYRYSGEPSMTNTHETLNIFPDNAQVSHFAVNAVAWAVENSVISGMNSGELAPTASASRAQIATIIMRMHQRAML